MSQVAVVTDSCASIPEILMIESFVAELSPALAVHTGPGTAGLCFYPPEG